MCYTDVMSRRITQRELRNESGRIMRALDKGESFTVTRNGVPVGELVPARARVFVAAAAVAAAYRHAPRIAPGRFRKDLDALIRVKVDAFLTGAPEVMAAARRAKPGDA